MGFLNISALFGLTAAAVPLILHLLSRRRKTVVPFSSVRFLHQMQKKEMNKLRIKRLLLLLVRTLAVISIVLAFSRPTIQGYLPGASSSTAAVIIIDNSLSMRMNNGKETAIDIALTTSSDIISSFNSGDKISVIPTEIEKNNSKVAAELKNPLEISLEEIQSTYGSSGLFDAVNEARKMLNSAEAANKEMYIISDFKQAANLTNQKAESEGSDDIHYYLIETKSNQKNYAVSKIDVKTKMLRQGGTASIEVEIQGDNATVNEIRIDLFLEGIRVGQSTVTPEVNSESKIIFVVPVKKSGFLKGFVEIEEDALIADNLRYFHLYVPQRIKVLAIGSDEDLIFSLFALNSTSAFGLNSTIEKISASNMDRVIMEDYDSIILSEFPSNYDRIAQHIMTYVRNGGGLLVLPGEEFDVDSYNRSLASMLGLPEITGVLSSDEGSNSHLSFNFVDWNHPLFTGIFSSGSKDYLSPKIRKIYQIINNQSGEDLIRLGGDIPFLKEYRFGEGRILFMLSAPILSWSDFPLKGLWVPFINRSVEYLMTGQSSYVDTLHVGNDLSFDLSNYSIDKKITVLSPGGKEFSIIPKSKKNKLTAEYFDTVFPGSYSLMVEGEEVSIQTVNIDKNELTAESGLDIFLRLTSSDNTVESKPSEILTYIRNSRLGIELWRYFAFLAFFLLLTEMALQKTHTEVEKREDEV